MKRLVAFVLLVSFGLVARAEEEPSVEVDGKIAELHAAATNDESVRVVLDGAPKLCGNAFINAYLNANDPNFAGMLELLIGAKSRHTPVTLVSKKDGRGHCKIQYLILRAGDEPKAAKP
jgi:hypothetical protein